MSKTTTCSIVRIEMPTPFAVGTVNAYLLQDSSAAVLVDCGPNYEPARQCLMDALAKHGVQMEDLTALVLTHGHVDHVGLAGMIQAAGVPVYAHPDVQTWLEPGRRWDDYRSEFFQTLYRAMGVPEAAVARAVKELFLLSQWTDRSVVNEELLPGDSLPWFPEYEILYVPGHAQAAIALWNENTGVLLPGDQLLPTISSNAFIEPELHHASGREAQRTPSLMQYRENLNVLRTLPIQQVYPGHGQPFTNTEKLITERLDGQLQRRQQFYEMVSAEPRQSAYDLATKYFRKHVNQLSLIMSETLGYLDWMEADGLLRCVENEQGVCVWEVTGRTPV